MAENPEFGAAPRIKEQYKKGNGAIGEVETYALNERQSIVHGQVIDHEQIQGITIILDQA